MYDDKNQRSWQILSFFHSALRNALLTSSVAFALIAFNHDRGVLFLNVVASSILLFSMVVCWYLSKDMKLGVSTITNPMERRMMKKWKYLADTYLVISGAILAYNLHRLEVILRS